MAGDWIKMRAALTSCPKVAAIARTIRATEPFSGVPKQAIRAMVVGGLHAVWSAVNEHTTDGVLAGLVVEDLDDMAGIDGFGSAMLEIGWVEKGESPKTLIFPNFDQWNTPAKDRTAAERMRKHREKQRVTANVTAPLRNVTPPLRRNVTPPLRNVTRNGPVTVTLDKTREREEKKPGNDEPPIGGSSSDGFSTAPAPPAAPVLGDAPERPPEATRGPKKARRVYRVNWTPETGFTGILEADREMWKKAFPAVDLELAFSQMNSWLISNPAKSKKSNWNLFIHRWLTREQDRGGNLKSNPVSKFQTHEERRNAQSLADREARAKANYSWREDAREMMNEKDYELWRKRQMAIAEQRRRETGDGGNEFLRIKRAE
jgi:hypothetical protein